MYCISSLVVCKIAFCSEFPNIPDSAGRKIIIRRTQAIARHYAFHANAIIPLYQLNKTFSPCFKFHSNLSVSKSSLKKLLPFYRHMLISWNQGLSGSPETSFQISQFLLFNKYSEIERTAINFQRFSNKDFNPILQLFENGKVITWVNLKDRYDWKMTCFFGGLNWNMQFLQYGKN